MIESRKRTCKWKVPDRLRGMWRKPAIFFGMSRWLMHRIRLGIADFVLKWRSIWARVGSRSGVASRSGSRWPWGMFSCVFLSRCKGQDHRKFLDRRSTNVDGTLKTPSRSKLGECRKWRSAGHGVYFPRSVDQDHNPACVCSSSSPGKGWRVSFWSLGKHVRYIVLVGSLAALSPVAICPSLYGCSSYQGDGGGPARECIFSSHQAPCPLTCGPCGVGGVWWQHYVFNLGGRTGEAIFPSLFGCSCYRRDGGGPNLSNCKADRNGRTSEAIFPSLLGCSCYRRDDGGPNRSDCVVDRNPRVELVGFSSATSKGSMACRRSNGRKRVKRREANTGNFHYAYFPLDMWRQTKTKHESWVGRVGAYSVPSLSGSLGWYFTALVNRPTRVAPTPNPCVISAWISACKVRDCKSHGSHGKRPDESKRRKPKTLVVEQGLHPHPGPACGRNGFDDSQATNHDDDDYGDDWLFDDRGDLDSNSVGIGGAELTGNSPALDRECDVHDAISACGNSAGSGDLEVVERAWNILMQPPAVDPSLLMNLSRMGCPRVAADMVPNRRHSVWNDPDASDDDEGAPPLAGDDSSDDELITVDEVESKVQQAGCEGYDTDEEIFFSDWIHQEYGSCRGEREGVLGVQAGGWNAVNWALDTSSGGTGTEPSRWKAMRGSEAVSADDCWNHSETCNVGDGIWQQPIACGSSVAEVMDDEWRRQTFTPHQWCEHDQAVEDMWFTRSSSSHWRPMNLPCDRTDPHTVSAESGEGWCLPTDEAAMPKLHRRGGDVGEKWVPMSAAKMRAAHKASVEREQWNALQTQLEEQRHCLRPVWKEAFDSPDPEDKGVEDYRQWVCDGKPGTSNLEVSFMPCDEYRGSWIGWVFKKGYRGLGYYLDGSVDNQMGEREEVEDLLRGLVPATLKLDGLVPNLLKATLDESCETRIGNLQKATMQDDKAKEGRKKARKQKAGKARKTKVANAQNWSLQDAISASDCSHRDHGLWAVETANPNAWSGATEYLSSSAADFLAFQEAKVDKADVKDAENTARGKRWSAAVSPCLQGVGGGNSAGVAVACREHIGMSTSCEEVDLPKSLQGRFSVKHIGAMCKGGFHLASGYLHSSLGIKHKYNMDLLQDAGVVLKTLRGPWIFAADFNATPEQLTETGWLKMVGGVIFAPERVTCKNRTIDFFVVSQDLAGSVVGACVVDDALFEPHRPVRLYIKANPRSMTVRTLKAATTIGATLPHGPLEKPAQLEEDLNDLSKDRLYELFLQRVEGEASSLQAAEGRAKEALKGRVEGPKFVIKNALGENDGGARRTTAVSRAYRLSSKWLNILDGPASAEEKRLATRRLRSYDHPGPESGGATPQQKRSFATFEAWRSLLTDGRLETSVWVAILKDMATQNAEAEERAAQKGSTQQVDQVDS